jgi:hypothetical protein
MLPHPRSRLLPRHRFQCFCHFQMHPGSRVLWECSVPPANLPRAPQFCQNGGPSVLSSVDETEKVWWVGDDSRFAFGRNFPGKKEISWPLLCSSGQSYWLQIQRFGSDSRLYQIFWEVMGLERGPFSLVSTTEELLRRNIRGSCLENRNYGRRGFDALTTRTPLSSKVGTSQIASGQIHDSK